MREARLGRKNCTTAPYDEGNSHDRPMFIYGVSGLGVRLYTILTINIIYTQLITIAMQR